MDTPARQPADSPAPIATDGGVTVTDSGQLGQTEIRALANEYRDAVLTSMGVVGTSDKPITSRIGKEIRTYSTGTPSPHDGVDDTGCAPVLYDTNHVDVADRIEGHPSAEYTTYRRGLRVTSRGSRPADAIAWDTVPTPRETRIAMYLTQLSEACLATNQNPIDSEYAATAIIDTVWPRYARDGDIWVDTRDAPSVHKVCLAECVSAVTDLNSKGGVSPVRIDRDVDDDNVYWRVASDDFVEELVSTEGSTTADRRVYYGPIEPEKIDAETSVAGEITAEGPGGHHVDTQVLTIPEAPRPEALLDLPRPPVRSPNT
ncbi:hypothetical protein RYH80_18570 [Halobaculum sp. MBLA0147]|uniref:hypothetical protein n=1 Tax=Halobaculum sp. MBLA0147 TaxID=3079934 RepID=UPI0035237DEC